MAHWACASWPQAIGPWHSNCMPHLQDFPHCLFRGFHLANGIPLRLKYIVLLQDVSGEVAIVLFIVIPGNLIMMLEQPGPPHFTVQPVPA